MLLLRASRASPAATAASMMVVVTVVEESKGHTMEEAAQGLQRQEGERKEKPPLTPSPLPPPRQQKEKEKVKRAVRWKRTIGCGACCKLDKGPNFPTPE
ncbi:hypothetical protein ABZP36_029525 [Zizania latifolia]